jgi:5'-phosphate synthase pdxT subunit
MTVGILALQGAFREHDQMLKRIGVATQLVRQPKHLEVVDRLIIPGGESTTIGTLMVIDHLLEPIRERASAGMPLWGTCAGAILMATAIAEGRPAGQPALALMQITARRNAFGSQLDSFEVDLPMPALGAQPLHSVFIRAPILEEPGPAVDVLATLPTGQIVAARQGNLLATCFHPELTNDERLHRYFLAL